MHAPGSTTKREAVQTVAVTVPTGGPPAHWRACLLSGNTVQNRLKPSMHERIPSAISYARGTRGTEPTASGPRTTQIPKCKRMVPVDVGTLPWSSFYPPGRAHPLPKQGGAGPATASLPYRLLSVELRQKKHSQSKQHQHHKGTPKKKKVQNGDFCQFSFSIHEHGPSSTREFSPVQYAVLGPPPPPEAARA